LRHPLAGSILEGDESLEERKESLGDLLRDLLPAEDQVEDVLAEILRQWDALQVWRNLDFRLSSSMIRMILIFLGLPDPSIIKQKK
jgi:hypothetical protein